MALTINEYKDVAETMKIVDSYIDDDTYDKAEYFDIVENPESLFFKVTLYNDGGEELVTFDVEDFDAVRTYLEEIFEVDDDDFDDYEGTEDEDGFENI